MRTGGIESADDLCHSAAAGVRLNQWYSGYFEQLAAGGHSLYARLYAELSGL